MKRFESLINALPLMAIGAIALVAIGPYLPPDFSGRRTVEPASSDSRPLPPMPDFDAQQSQTYQLVPGSISDGDTLRVTDGRAELRIRLCGIDAPEKDQPLGIAARDHLRSLINKGDGSVIVVPVEQDRYGRTVAELFIWPRSGQGYQSGEEIAVNAQMVADGYAYHYARYSNSCPNGQVLSQLEANAKQQRLGVWRDVNAVRPWEYRQQQR